MTIPNEHGAESTGGAAAVTPPASPPASPAATVPDASPTPALRHHGGAPAAKPTSEQPSATRENVAPERQEQQQQEQHEPYTLQTPAFVPMAEQTEERQGFVNDFSAMAPSIGIEASHAQAILDVAVDALTALGGDYSRSFELEHATAEEGYSEMVRLFGEDRAKGVLTNCHRYVEAHGGDRLRDWLDTTGLGNDPAVIVALATANTGWFSATPEQAQQRIDELMKSEEYRRGDKLAMVRLHMLTRLAHRDALSAGDRLNAAALERQMTQPAAPAAGSDAEVRARIAKLLDPKGELLAGGPGQAAAKQEYFALLAKLN
jgi:hypothetical protein